MSLIINNCFLFISCAVVLTNQSTYKAAVVEYKSQITTSDISEDISKNVDNYVKIITGAAIVGTDIIVFPESSLNDGFSNDRNRIIEYAFYIPDPLENIVPCDSSDYSEALKKLSCAAKSSKIYVVINVSEKNVCTNENDHKQCARDDHNLYNSNVVFDRTGRVVSRYRKTHLFGEVAFNTTSVPEIETFTTDFNVTFGHLICFDIIFNTPSTSLLNGKGVRNFIVPMMWYSELPFLTAIQYQESWAYTHNVNLLVAGANNPKSGSGGSGIYAGRHGAQAAFLTGDHETKVLTSVLDGDLSSSENHKNIESSNPERMSFLRDNLDVYSWKPMDFSTKKETSEDICYGDFCCNIFTRISKQTDGSSNAEKHYMAVAFDGVRSFAGKATGGVQTCGIIACSRDTISTCGKGIMSTADQDVNFEEIIIIGNFRSENTSQFPVSLQDNLIPLTPENYIYSTKTIDGVSNIKFQLTKHTNNLLTFAIFGRDFSKDGMPGTSLNEVVLDAQISPIKNNFSSYSMKIDNLSEESALKSITNQNESELIGDNEQTYWEYFSVRLQICLFVITIYFLEML